MAKTLTLAELRKMNQEDLQKEVAVLRRTISKGRYDVASGKQKDSHNYQINKKQLARMLTVLKELNASTSRPSQSSERSAQHDANTKKTAQAA